MILEMICNEIAWSGEEGVCFPNQNNLRNPFLLKGAFVCVSSESFHGRSCGIAFALAFCVGLDSCLRWPALFVLNGS